MDICSAEGKNVERNGHPITCYMNPLLCASKFIYLNVLSFHHPKLRTFKRKIYLLKQYYRLIQNIESSLEKSDVIEIRIILAEAQNFSSPITSVRNEICLDENKIKRNLHEGLIKFIAILMDTPTIPCVSCERLFSNKDITHVSELKKSYIIPTLLGVKMEDKIDYVKQLMEYCEQAGIKTTTICKSCCTSLKNYKMPSMCVLNNLFISKLPPELNGLNNFEKILIQPMKAFQTVVKMDTVAKKIFPTIRVSVIYRCFHLRRDTPWIIKNHKKNKVPDEIGL